jgi:putative ATPase
MAASIAHACVESAKSVGMPEAAIPLSNLVCILATAPKSNTAHIAYESAKSDILAGLGLDVPLCLRSPNFEGYKYPHDYENDYVEQEYLPRDLKNRKYYNYGTNKTEQAARTYQVFIRANNKNAKKT